MKVAVIQFPGSNCDADALHAARLTLDQGATFVWHAREGLPTGTDLVILPGGFSYGDHLRRRRGAGMCWAYATVFRC